MPCWAKKFASLARVEDGQIVVELGMEAQPVRCFTASTRSCRGQGVSTQMISTLWVNPQAWGMSFMILVPVPGGGHKSKGKPGVGGRIPAATRP